MSQATAHRIVLALQARCEAITKAGGYATDAGLRVYRGRDVVTRSDSFPLLVIHRDPEEVVGAQGGRQFPGVSLRLRMAFGIEGHIEADPDNPLDAAHAVIADIKQAIFLPTDRLVPETTELAYTDSFVERRGDGASIASVAVNGHVEFTEEVGQPIP